VRKSRSARHVGTHTPLASSSSLCTPSSSVKAAGSKQQSSRGHTHKENTNHKAPTRSVESVPCIRPFIPTVLSHIIHFDACRPALLLTRSSVGGL
jgi:hypothetical protein